MAAELTAKRFVAELEKYRSEKELKKYEHYFKTGPGDYAHGDKFMGVFMGQVFKVAKEYMDMAPSEIEKLLESPIHEVRAGGCSIMFEQGRSKETPPARRKELYNLYLRRHDRINNWDLVDRCAPDVIGNYLQDKPRDILYKLARSKNMWERRTAIVSTYYFVKKGDLDDTFKIAEILVHDDQDLVQKAVGGWLRDAGKRDKPRLLKFLDKYAATMPRTALRYAIEHFDRAQKDHYMGLKKTSAI